MNLFTFSRQTETSDRRAGHGNTFNLRRFVGGLLAALTGVVMAFSAPSEAYAQGGGVDCASASAVGAGTYTYDAITASGTATACYTGGTGARWYSFTAPADGAVSIEACGGVDTRLSVFSGTCGSFTCIANNDDSGNTACEAFGYASAVSGVLVTSGQTIYIQWDDRWSSSSSSWSLSFVPTPTGGPCDAPNVVGALPVVGEAINCDGFNDFTSSNVANVCGSTSYYGGQDALYSFTPANTADYNITISGQTWTGIMVYDACPLTGACVGQIQNSSSSKTLTVSLTAGVEYFIIFDTFPSPVSPCPGTYSISEVVPPAAGECTNTTAFGSGTAPTNNIPVNISTCTYQSEYNTLSGVVAGNTYISDYQIASASNGWVTVRSGSPAGPVVATGNAPLTWTAAAAGTHYIHYNTSDACGTASTCGVTSITCSSCPPPPPISWCDTATPIACDSSVSGTTVGASTEAIPATCGTTNSSGGKIGYILSGNDEDVIADTFGSAIDTKLWVYEYNGGCQPGDLVCVGGNDDAVPGSVFESRVQFFGALGQDYLIVVGAFSSFDEGNYTLNVGCGVIGCTDPTACNFDAAADLNDGCFYICNDVPAGAVLVSTTNLGTCSAIAGNLQGATSSGEGTVGAAGNDLWYMFNAATSGVRIELTATGFDAVLELQEMDGTVVNTEDLTFTNGAEILNFGGLTPGTDYRVRVASFFSGGTNSRPFNLCIQNLPETRCDLNAGVTSIERSLCQTVKARWSGPSATNYTFHFTPVGGGTTISYETGAAFTIAPLQNVPGLLWNASYDIQIDVELSLTRGNGSAETITVPGTNFCELVISDAPVAALRESDNQTNAGALPLSAFIAATPWVCTVTEWEWVFTNTNGSQLAITHFSGAPSRFLRLSTVPGLIAGDVYNVQVRPVFANGYIGAFGATDQIAILGALGMAGDITSPVANTEIDERVEETVVATGVALYPNPNRGDFVNVNIANVAEGVDRVIFDLYDLTGKRVISEQIAVAGSGVNVVMPLNGLANGMYIANIIVGEEVHTERIAVQK